MSLVHKTTRRSFLKLCGMAGMGLSLAPVLPAFAAETLLKETRFLMGTIVTVMVVSSEKDRARAAMDCAFAEMERVSGLLDHHAQGSPLHELNATGTLAHSPDELLQVVLAAQQYGVQSGHAFDMTVKPLLDLMQAHKNPSGEMRLDRADVTAALNLVEPEGVVVAKRRITLRRQGMGLTLDGIAKGFVVDRACAVLEEQGIRNALVNAGGDIRALGLRHAYGQEWVVAVEDPEKRFQYPARVALSNRAIATSGSYEMRFDSDSTYHHLVNPQTGACPQHALSVSVTAPSAMEADALATALCVVPPQTALAQIAKLPDRECLIVCRDGKVFSSAGWA